MIEKKRIQIRRDIAQNWRIKNPVLLQGEIGFDMTENNIKIGDGYTTWNSLPYITSVVDLSQYYTKEEIDELLSRIDIPTVDLSGYYTKEETETKIEEAVQGIEIPKTDLSNYYTKEETETKIEEAVQGIEIPEIPEIPDIPVVGAGNITIRQGETSQTFNVNQTEDAEIFLQAGGDSSDSNDWYGTQEEFDNLDNYDANTKYHISEINYNEISNTPNIPNNTTNFNTKAVKNIVDKKQWFGTQEEFDALGRYDSDVIYNIETTEGGGSGENVDLSDYYTKEETEAAVKTQVDEKIDKKLWFGTQEEYNALENKEDDVTYYIEVENQAVYDMANYYTKEEIDAKFAQING